MQKEGILLPPGYRFKPLDYELINFYLKPKVMRQELPCHIINDDIKVYAPDSTPWLLFDLDDPHSWIDSITNAEKTIYVFTTLSKLATVSNTTTTRIRSNTSKKAGCGAWVQRTKRVPIIDRDGNVIGGKRMLNFEIHDAGFNLDKAVYFKMHEYSLWGVNERLGSDVVLCEITFDPCKEPFRKLATKKVSRRGRKPQNKIQKNKNLEADPCKEPFGKLATKNVSRRGRKPRNKIQKNKNLEGSSTLNSESVPVMSGNVYQESTSLHPESLVPLDGGVGNAEFSGDLCFDAQGGESLCSDEDLLQSFDISGFLEYLESNPLGEPLEDTTIGGLGKRKFAEEDNSCQAKKMCFS
ncbi:hypothetical protein POM88_038578 [Heracleum sosnowskyi]|uniref:NAC domain-containing protein n=1 Tax=Heracleum sosnowskyi TaxID=360622 RepID=A0AAD8M811_9APIA|nr:hypothetical protein POM88_038578 [Heracleum sosnowskyi]